MNPGRELDALVAEKVMGLKLVTTFPGDRAVRFLSTDDRYSRATGYEQRASHMDDVPKYSTSIAAAWEVVEKLKDRGFNLWRKFNNDGYFCHFHQPGSYAWGSPQGDAITVPHAICLAALKAVGYKFD